MKKRSKNIRKFSFLADEVRLKHLQSISENIEVGRDIFLKNKKTNISLLLGSFNFTKLSSLY
jgi:hypothetical protein